MFSLDNLTILVVATPLALLLVAWQTVRVIRRDRRLTTQNLDLTEQRERARRERAAEHIRAEAMAMNTTDDLAPVCGVLLREIQALGVPTRICEIAFVDEDAQRQHFYWASEDVIRYRLDEAADRVRQLADGTTVSSGIVHINRWKHFADHWRRGEPRVSRWSESGVKFAAQTLSEDIGIGEGALAELDMGLGALALTTPFQHGVVWTASSQIDEADVPRIQAVLRELADAFTVGYRRFLDFQQLEEQNRALDEANQQIQQASEHKSQFLARMSHDLRTPMNAIIGYTRILLRRAQDTLDPRHYRNLENIHTSADNLLGLINDILDLSRIEAGRIDLNPQDVDLRQIIAECTASVESLLEPGVQLRQDLNGPGTIRTDPDRIRRVLMNLLGNAVKFTETGSITLAFDIVGEWHQLSVTDTGIGIPADQLPHIFEEFRQADQVSGDPAGGSGLGLAIARKSVELLGGTITAESEVGRGTTFTVRLRDLA